MAKRIMIQGTMSNAGKSVLAAGLCRIFKQDGFRVSPFKSQNMALNSFITADGLEMGRAQVMQAEAAGIEPSVYMNPILLKPTSDVGSQVIVNGEVVRNMSAREYFSYKKNLIPEILAAYRYLDEKNDIVVIEGAGSPAEINLKQNDIVNMGLAQLINAPVLLVGDIDRGGVFAQLLGTLQLLESGEQKRVEGLIINKFRGDKSLLDSGISILEEKTGKNVIGTIPYLSVSLEDEDSLSQRFSQKKEGTLQIGVVQLPHISNFTDFNAFDQVEEVSVHYITKPWEVAEPDILVIPGSKNTMADLQWIRECGLEKELCKRAEKKPILGICGGFQMLGEEISDPSFTEAGGSMKGIGLLPVRTILKEQKTRSRVNGNVSALSGVFQPLSGCQIEGYEIHQGETMGIVDQETTSFSTLLRMKETRYVDGAVKGNVAGTYLHGIFDGKEFLERFCELLANQKGIHFQNNRIRNYREFKEDQFDQLAKGIRANLDMDRIYRIMDQY